MDRYGQNYRRCDEALTAQAAGARIDELLDAVSSVRDLVRRRDDMVRLLADLLVAGEDGDLAACARFTGWKSLLAAGIARARENGDLATEADPDRLATGLMAALRGGLLLARTTRDIGQLETALDMALGHLQAHAVTR